MYRTFFCPSFFPPFPSLVPSFLLSLSPSSSQFAFFTTLILCLLLCLLLLPLHSPGLRSVNTCSRKSRAQCIGKVGTVQSLSLFPQNT